MGNENQELQSYSPHGLISQALAQNVPIETLERLMDLQERWQSGQAKSEFLKAMTNFQSKVPQLIKSKKVDYPSQSGGSVKYNYTPLSSISKTIQPILNECGLSYRWEFEDLVDGKIKCQCVVSHIAGHSEINTMTAAKDTTGKKNDIQSIGSTRQYLQRYTLIGALGLSTADEDNDGKTSEAKKTDSNSIPAPIDKNKEGEIRKCMTIKSLNELYAKYSSEDQSTYKKIFSSVKALIEDAAKKEKSR